MENRGLDVIPVGRRQAPEPLIRKDPAPLRREHDRAIRNWAILSGVEMAIILAQLLVIYVLQAGPI